MKNDMNEINCKRKIDSIVVSVKNLVSKMRDTLPPNCDNCSIAIVFPSSDYEMMEEATTKLKKYNFSCYYKLEKKPITLKNILHEKQKTVLRIRYSNLKEVDNFMKD